jgi:hypothetical protein
MRRVLAAAVFIAALITSAGSANAWQHGFRSRVFASGANLTHSTPSGQETLTQPDDITYLDGHVFVGFQNGVGAQGGPSLSGNPNSTVVEFALDGRAIRQWDITGKCDGLTADPQTDQLIATVNEDGNSSIYLISPATGPVHYQYDEPLPSNGGTDAITIHHGMVLVSASAPGTTGAPAPQASYPAVYQVTFDSFTHTAFIAPLFYDESPAAVANVDSPQFGQQLPLALTDPDSSENVPRYADRFGGDFMLTSQGDQQQIFVRHAGRPRQRLSVLNLSASVDDAAWPSSPYGAILTTNNGADTIDAITGRFQPGAEYVAVTPCDENSAPSTCPAPPQYPANYFGVVDPYTGTIVAVPVEGAAIAPQGMLFLP